MPACGAESSNDEAELALPDAGDRIGSAELGDIASANAVALGSVTRPSEHPIIK